MSDSYLRRRLVDQNREIALKIRCANVNNARGEDCLRKSPVLFWLVNPLLALKSPPGVVDDKIRVFSLLTSKAFILRFQEVRSSRSSCDGIR